MVPAVLHLKVAAVPVLAKTKTKTVVARRQTQVLVVAAAQLLTLAPEAAPAVAIMEVGMS